MISWLDTWERAGREVSTAGKLTLSCIKQNVFYLVHISVSRILHYLVLTGYSLPLDYILAPFFRVFEDRPRMVYWIITQGLHIRGTVYKMLPMVDLGNAHLVKKQPAVESTMVTALVSKIVFLHLLFSSCWVYLGSSMANWWWPISRTIKK